MIEPDANTASRILELQDHYSQYGGEVEANILDQLTANEIAWTLDRIATNKTNNGTKIKWLDWAF
jgi:hypothetical protein